jgi:hypothetical protein
MVPVRGRAVKLPHETSDATADRIPEVRMTPQGLTKTVTAGVTGAGMVIALTLGFGPATAHADVLDDLVGQYHTGAGAGPVAVLATQSLKLRNAGFRPTAAEYDEIAQALKKGPNQMPLVHALQDVVAGQTRQQNDVSALQGSGQQPATFGINQYNPDNPGGVTAGPGGVGLGGGANQYVLGGAPGR